MRISETRALPLCYTPRRDYCTRFTRAVNKHFRLQGTFPSIKSARHSIFIDIVYPFSMPTFIDAHAHLASWPNIETCKRNLVLGNDIALISHADCSSFPGERGASRIISAYDGLQECLQLAKELPGRFYAAVWIKPLIEPMPSKELIDLISQNISFIKAIKLHPFCERISPDDERMEPYYQFSRELSLPILSHTALDEHSCIAKLVNAAKKHPDLNFVASHLELGSDHEYSIRALAEVPNVYVDTAWVDLYHANKAMDILGEDHVMFGSDSPIDGLSTLDNPLYQEYFHNTLGLWEGRFRRLMGENAKNFYRLY